MSRAIPYSAAVAVVSVLPLRNSEQSETNSAFLGPDFLPSTLRSKRMSRELRFQRNENGSSNYREEWNAADQ